MSSNSTSPANIYGGTWSAISGGRYMRAAGAWGNGGSNTITIKQMPAHTHQLTRTLQNNVSAGGTNLVASGSTEGGSYTWTTHSTGGGQHSTPLTKTFGRGTEQPKEGERLCVTFKQFKSGVVARLKRFVHSQLATSICQAIRQVQQTFMAARGHLSQMVDFGEQVVHGMVQAVSQHTNSLLTKCQIIHMLYYYLGEELLETSLYRGHMHILEDLLVDILAVLVAVMHTITSRLTVPATAGIAPRRQIRGEL